MVIFGRSVFYLFGRLVNNSAVRFSIFSAVWIRPYVEVRTEIPSIVKKLLYNKYILRFESIRGILVGLRHGFCDLKMNCHVPI